MKIVVTTPTGHIGNKLANILLDRKSDVTLIARHPEKVRNLASRGAKVVAGEHSNPAVLEQAVSAADALFWLTPSEITSHDPLGIARRMAEAGASVIRNHPNLHVIQLSSAGAFLPSGTGPIVGLHDTEEKFRAAGKYRLTATERVHGKRVFLASHYHRTKQHLHFDSRNDESAVHCHPGHRRNRR